jgi:predicted HicB family RNase H-like nuclease
MGNYKHPNEQRTSVVTVRMTPEDRERLTKLAAKEKLSISDLIRKWIQETPLRERKRKEDETISTDR